MEYIKELFGYEYRPTQHELPNMILPQTFTIGVLFGGSGSGKTRLFHKLKQDHGISLDCKEYQWLPSTPVIEQIKCETKEGRDTEKVVEKLLACGFCSVPQWFLSFEDLSEGQKVRLQLCQLLEQEFIWLDEFTSKLDRLTARNLAFNIYKYAVKHKKKLVIATPFWDIVPYLSPDWVYDCDSNQFICREKKWDYNTKPWLFSFESNVTGSCKSVDHKIVYVVPTQRKTWQYYKKHHYLSGELNANAESFEIYVYCESKRRNIGFIAIAPLPLSGIKARREHRLVIVPELQGMGLGSSLSEFIGDYYRKQGYHYYCKTSHPKLGKYRNSSPKWIATGKNGKPNQPGFDPFWSSCTKLQSINKTFFCHEYIGTPLVYALQSPLPSSSSSSSVKEKEEKENPIEEEKEKENPIEEKEEEDNLIEEEEEDNPIEEKEGETAKEEETAKDIAETFQFVQLFDAGWKPLKLFGKVLYAPEVRPEKCFIIFKHKKRAFSVYDFANQDAMLKHARDTLEHLNIQQMKNKLNLYKIHGDAVHIKIYGGPIFAVDVAQFESIRDKNWLFRHDYVRPIIFYLKNKKRITIESVVGREVEIISAHNFYRNII